MSNSYLNSPFGYRVGDACGNLKIRFGVGVELGLGLHPRSEICLPFLCIPFQKKIEKEMTSHFQDSWFHDERYKT